MRLTKAVATGNDFLLVDLTDPAGLKRWNDAHAPFTRDEWVRLWCDRHDGIGADGALFIEADAGGDADFGWDFYNSDGSSAEMCGNAARAVTLVMGEKSGRGTLRFRTRIGVVEGRVHGTNDVEVTLPPVTESRLGQKQDGITYDFIRAGVPHVVIRRKPEERRLDLLNTVAMKVRDWPPFREEGTNVTFIMAKGADEVDSITFERGVDDFTLSCGTGAVAAAYALTQGAADTAVSVHVPGGDLTVTWRGGRPHLRGEARRLATVDWLGGPPGDGV